MRNNIIGFKINDSDLFALDRPFNNTDWCYQVIRIHGEAKDLKKLCKIIKNKETFAEETLINLNLNYREIN